MHLWSGKIIRDGDAHTTSYLGDKLIKEATDSSEGRTGQLKDDFKYVAISVVQITPPVEASAPSTESQS